MSLRIFRNFVVAVIAMSTAVIALAESTSVIGDYPLGFKAGGSLSGGDGPNIVLVCWANKEPSTEKYAYVYTLENAGKVSYLLQFGLLNYVLSGQLNRPFVFEMRPGQTRKFTLVHEEAPVRVSSRLDMFQMGNEKPYPSFEHSKKMAASDYEFWASTRAASFDCPLPPSLLKPRQ